MYTIVYFSTAAKNLTSKDISNILETARDFNFKNDISGCLIYHNNHFCQILEGDKTILDELFFNITKDSRHFNVNILYENYSKKRSFKLWNMAFIDAEAIVKNGERKIFVDNLRGFLKLVKSSTVEFLLFKFAVLTFLKENDTNQ
jgi:hypothetical protein